MSNPQQFALTLEPEATRRPELTDAERDLIDRDLAEGLLSETEAARAYSEAAE